MDRFRSTTFNIEGYQYVKIEMKIQHWTFIAGCIVGAVVACLTITYMMAHNI